MTVIVGIVRSDQLRSLSPRVGFRSGGVPTLVQFKGMGAPTKSTGVGCTSMLW